MNKPLIITMAAITAYAIGITPLAYTEAKRQAVAWMASLPEVTATINAEQEAKLAAALPSSLFTETLPTIPARNPRR